MAPRTADAVFHQAIRRDDIIGRRRAAIKSMAIIVVKQLRVMDWVSKHEYFNIVTGPSSLGGRSPESDKWFAKEIMVLMSPDELLGGMRTGAKARATIIAKDKSLRQLQLTDVGFRRRRPLRLRQTSLIEWCIVGIGR
jgi:hypothetical protein